MSLVYRMLYGIGFTPWDTGEVPSELKRVVEGNDAAAHRALDLGCGTGTQALYMADHGWQVTAVDSLDKPLRRARARGEAAGLEVDWRRGDVTRLQDLGLEPGYTLLFDRGCYHGLSDSERGDYVRGVRDLAAPDAVLLVMCFARNRIPAAPGGVDGDEVAAAFSSAWELVSATADSGAAPAGPLGKVPRTWYRLRRRVSTVGA